MFYKNEFLEKQPRGIQSVIMLAFSVVSILLILLLGLVLFSKFTSFQWEKTIQSTERLMNQTSEKIEDYLVNMRQISDAAYYNVIKEKDLTSEQAEIKEGLNLLYEANRNSLEGIAIYNQVGSLEGAEPVVSQKEDPDVTRQEWFQSAIKKPENMHFSTPHVQNLFDNGTMKYQWVISLSRVIELTKNSNAEQGVLLVDMDYSKLTRMMKQMNGDHGLEYFYLCDKDGEIIYHPRQGEISKGIYKENNKEDGILKNGVYERTFNGNKRKILVNTIGYTGWKLVGVIPSDTIIKGMIDMRYFVVLWTILMAMMLLAINQLVSDKISKPILRLNQSVSEYEAGEKPDIYLGGSEEIRHLSNSIQKSYEENDALMKELLEKEREKRKSELDALQSQIHPHFLYNTLESITWMIEDQRNDEAVMMISNLAKLFRISLSKGHTVISVKEELQHAMSYMNIQKIRYKNNFSVEFHVDEELYSYATVKLILQPLLENSIHYGMQCMDECGKIQVFGSLKDDCMVLSVVDNGTGMTREEASAALKDHTRVQKKGSGVGLVNVNNRIKLLFGEAYGLEIESELDEGTRVSIILPKIPFTEENREALEHGTYMEMEKV